MASEEAMDGRPRTSSTGEDLHGGLDLSRTSGSRRVSSGALNGDSYLEGSDLPRLKVADHIRRISGSGRGTLLHPSRHPHGLGIVLLRTVSLLARPASRLLLF